MSDYKPVILEDYIGLSAYTVSSDPLDPGKKDIGFLVYVASLIPKKPTDVGKVDAGVMASLCLSAHQEASKNHAEALMWWRMKDIKTNAELARAINDITVATNADKKAKQDANYIKAAELSAKGEAITRFYDGVKNNFETGHYWAKEKEKSDNSEKKMSGYEPHSLKLGGAQGPKRDTEQIGSVSFE